MKKILILFFIVLFPFTSYASLRFSTSGTMYVDHGNAGGSTPNAGTVYAWVKKSNDTDTTGRIFVKQTSTVSTTGFWVLNIPGVATRLRCTIDFVSSDADAASANNTFVGTSWQFVACSYDGVNAPKLYMGTTPQNLAETAYNGTPVAGTGGRVSDSGGPVLVGSNAAGGAGASFPGDIAMINWIPGKALTLNELKGHMMFPRPYTDSTGVNYSAIFTFYGFNSLGTQADWSGKKNNGTVNGSPSVFPNAPLANPFGR